MLSLIAQTTQPDLSNWSPAAVIAVVGAIVGGIVTVSAAIGAVIMAWKSNTKATAADVKSDATQQSVTRLSNRQNAAETKVVDLAAAMPPKGTP